MGFSSCCSPVWIPCDEIPWPIRFCGRLVKWLIGSLHFSFPMPCTFLFDSHSPMWLCNWALTCLHARVLFTYIMDSRLPGSVQSLPFLPYALHLSFIFILYMNHTCVLVFFFYLALISLVFSQSSPDNIHFMQNGFSLCYSPERTSIYGEMLSIFLKSSYLLLSVPFSLLTLSLFLLMLWPISTLVIEQSIILSVIDQETSLFTQWSFGGLVMSDL